MLDRLKAALSKTTVDPNHSTDEEVYVPFGVTEFYDPGYEPGDDDPGDFEEMEDVPDSEVEGK